MMGTLEEEIKSYIESNTKDKIKEFYYDWNLDEKSGMFLFIFEQDHLQDSQSYVNKQLVEQKTIELSKEIQKTPESTYSKLLNERTLIVVRQGILISLEKEFIHLGFSETLKIAKRKLEKKVINKHLKSYETYLDAKVIDYFVDWNFDEDKSFTLFILKP